MTPVEIVARELARFNGYDPDGAAGGPGVKVWEPLVPKAQAALDALTAAGWRPPLEPGFVVVDRSWLAQVALLLHTMTEEGQEVEGESDTWDLFMALGPVLGFDEHYESDSKLRAMIAASQSTEQQP